MGKYSKAELMLESAKSIFKKYFISGLLVLLPLAGTLWLLKTLILTADSFFNSFIPRQFRSEAILGYDIPGLGLITAIGFVTLVGVLTRLYIANKLLKLGDKIIAKLPLGRGIYTAMKQFLNTILAEDKSKKFNKVVLIEYPRRGSYAIAFVTSEFKHPKQLNDKKHLYIFVPTTPNPTSGFLLIMPEEEVIPLDIPVEDAFKLLISGGIVSSES